MRRHSFLDVLQGGCSCDLRLEGWLVVLILLLVGALPHSCRIAAASIAQQLLKFSARSHVA